MLTELLHNLRHRENAQEGATAVEYGIMVALIAVVIIIAVTLLGENLFDVFSSVAESVTTVNPT